MGRLSASELCSLPIVPAAMAAEQRWDWRSPFRRRDDRAGTGIRTGLLRVWAPQRVAVCGRCAQPTKGRRMGNGEPLFGERMRHAERHGCTPFARLPSTNPKVREADKSGLRPRPPPASSTALTHSLQRCEPAPSRTRIGCAG